MAREAGRISRRDGGGGNRTRVLETRRAIQRRDRIRARSLRAIRTQISRTNLATAGFADGVVLAVGYGIDDVTLGFDMEGSGSIERLNTLPGSQTRGARCSARLSPAGSGRISWAGLSRSGRRIRTRDGVLPEKCLCRAKTGGRQTRLCRERIRQREPGRRARRTPGAIRRSGRIRPSRTPAVAISRTHAAPAPVPSPSRFGQRTRTAAPVAARAPPRNVCVQARRSATPGL
jgi:hypothetical protein